MSRFGASGAPGTYPAPPRKPRKRRGRWQDAYRVGQLVEVHHGDRWMPAIVTRKTATGQPEVRTEGDSPVSLGSLRKSELRPRPDDKRAPELLMRRFQI